MKEILLFLSGAMFGGLVAFSTLCLFAGIRSKDDEKYGEKSNEKGHYDV